MRTMIHTQFKSGIRFLAVVLVMGLHMDASAQKKAVSDESRTIPNFRALWGNEPFAKYDPANEVVEKRDQVSKHFRNADGTITSHVASGPIHYLEDGQWKTIFHTIEKDANNGFSNNYNFFKSQYPAELSNSGIETQLPDGIKIRELNNARMYFEKSGVKIDETQINNTTRAISNRNEISYTDVYNHIDLRYVQNSISRKLDYIIKEPFVNTSVNQPDYVVFEETIMLPEGSKVSELAEGLLVSKDGKIVCRFDNPSIYDAAGSGKFSNEKLGFYEYAFDGTVLILKTKFQFAWLADQERQFPIYADPTTCYIVTGGNLFQSAIDHSYSSTGVETSLPASLTSYDCYGGFSAAGTDFTVGRFANVSIGNGNNAVARTAWLRNAVRFDLSSLNDSYDVASADLTFYVNSQDANSSGGTGTIGFYNYGTLLGTTSTCTNVFNGFSTSTTAHATSFNDYTTGSKTRTLNSSALANITSQLSSNWYAIAFIPGGTWAAANTEFVIASYTSANKPYITVVQTDIPTVTTTTASSIGNTTASSGGNVSSDGGVSVTERGVLWGTSPGLTMPTVSSTSNGTGTGSFTSSITGLSTGTVYYYRAYARNSVGYGYGIEYSFVTTGSSGEGYYISGNIVNNGEIISTYDENYLRMTGAGMTITGSGKFTDSKLFANGSTTYNADLNAASAFSATFVNAGNSLTIADAKTFKNGTMLNNGTLTIAGTGIINNTANWVNGATGTVTVSASGTIYAGANWTNDGTFTAGTGTVEFNGSTSENIISGNTNFYNATINKGSSTATILDVNGTVTQAVASNLTFTNGLLRIPAGGSWTKSASGAIIGANSGLHVNGGTFTLNGASITNNGLFKTTTGTATIGNSSGNSITNQAGSSFIIDGAGTVNIAGRMEATGSGSFNQSAGTLNVCTSANGSSTFGSIDMATTSSFTMSGGAINVVKKSTGSTQIDYKNLASTVSISAGTLTIGTAATAASSNFNIQGAMPPLVVDNTTNAKTATINGASTVYGNVTINPTSSLVLNSDVTAAVKGNWVNNGTFTSNAVNTLNAVNTVVFNGASAQTITEVTPSTFSNVTIDNTSDVSMLSDLTVANTLTLTNGKFIVGGSKILYIGSASANGTITGGSTSNYIVAYDDGTTIGKLQRAINTAASTSYVFPIGDLSSYTPVNYTLTSGTLSNANVSVYTKPIRIAAMNISLQTYLNRYWEVTPTGISASNYSISYNYATADINSMGNESNLLPVKLSGGVWYRPIGSAFQTGLTEGTGSVDIANNLLTWTGLTTYSGFSGAGNEAVNLPVELVVFTGECVDRKNILKWESFTEMNNDYYTIENTIDGISFEEIGKVDGAGNASEINAYELVHENYRNAINYYRLKQTDIDGLSKYSELISIDNRSGVNEKEIVSITNLLGQEINENYKGLVIVTFIDGSSVKRIQ